MTNTPERWMPWLARLAWLVVGLSGAEVLDGALDAHSSVSVLLVRLVAGIIWLIGVAAVMVPAVTTLTLARVVVPLAIPGALVGALAGGPPVPTVVAAVAAGTSAVLIGAAPIGRSFVQASAYGREDRFPLRPPASYLLAAALAWMVWAGLVMATVIALGAGWWWAAGLAGVAAGAVSMFTWPRWHRLARRWLVVVPVGIVVHDHLVLAETLMLRRHEIASVDLARLDTGALDLTGPAGGHALEIVTHDSVTAVRAGTPAQPGGSAFHLTACLVAPSRPGQALTALRQRD